MFQFYGQRELHLEQTEVKYATLWTYVDKTLSMCDTILEVTKPEIEALQQEVQLSGLIPCKLLSPTSQTNSISLQSIHRRYSPHVVDNRDLAISQNNICCQKNTLASQIVDQEEPVSLPAHPITAHGGSASLSVTVPKDLIVTPVTSQKDVIVTPATNKKALTVTPGTSQKDLTVRPITVQKNLTVTPVTSQKDLTVTAVRNQKDFTTPPITGQTEVTAALIKIQKNLVPSGINQSSALRPYCLLDDIASLPHQLRPMETTQPQEDAVKEEMDIDVESVDDTLMAVEQIRNSQSSVLKKFPATSFKKVIDDSLPFSIVETSVVSRDIDAEESSVALTPLSSVKPPFELDSSIDIKPSVDIDSCITLESSIVSNQYLGMEPSVVDESCMAKKSTFALTQSSAVDPSVQVESSVAVEPSTSSAVKHSVVVELSDVVNSSAVMEPSPTTSVPVDMNQLSTTLNLLTSIEQPEFGKKSSPSRKDIFLGVKHQAGESVEATVLKDTTFTIYPEFMAKLFNTSTENSKEDEQPTTVFEPLKMGVNLATSHVVSECDEQLISICNVVPDELIGQKIHEKIPYGLDEQLASSSPPSVTQQQNTTENFLEQKNEESVTTSLHCEHNEQSMTISGLSELNEQSVASNIQQDENQQSAITTEQLKHVSPMSAPLQARETETKSNLAVEEIERELPRGLNDTRASSSDFKDSFNTKNRNSKTLINLNSDIVLRVNDASVTQAYQNYISLNAPHISSSLLCETEFKQQPSVALPSTDTIKNEAPWELRHRYSEDNIGERADMTVTTQVDSIQDSDKALNQAVTKSILSRKEIIKAVDGVDVAQTSEVTAPENISKHESSQGTNTKWLPDAMEMVNATHAGTIAWGDALENYQNITKDSLASDCVLENTLAADCGEGKAIYSISKINDTKEANFDPTVFTIKAVQLRQNTDLPEELLNQTELSYKLCTQPPLEKVQHELLNIPGQETWSGKVNMDSEIDAETTTSTVIFKKKLPIKSDTITNIPEADKLDAVTSTRKYCVPEGKPFISGLCIKAKKSLPKTVAKKVGSPRFHSTYSLESPSFCTSNHLIKRVRLTPQLNKDISRFCETTDDNTQA